MSLLPPKNVVNLTREQVKAGLADGSIRLVDVREPHEFSAGHIPGATLNALQSFDPSALPAAEPGKQVAFSCRTGARSLTALALAQSAGRNDIVAHYLGGFKEWSEAGEKVDH